MCYLILGVRKCVWVDIYRVRCRVTVPSLLGLKTGPKPTSENRHGNGLRQVETGCGSSQIGCGSAQNRAAADCPRLRTPTAYGKARNRLRQDSQRPAATLTRPRTLPGAENLRKPKTSGNSNSTPGTTNHLENTSQTHQSTQNTPDSQQPRKNEKGLKTKRLDLPTPTNPNRAKPGTDLTSSPP